MKKIESVSILSYDRCIFEFFWPSQKNVRAAFASFRAHFSSRVLSVFLTLPPDAYGHLLWDGDETLRRELKIQLAAEYFWRNSRCFIWWWNTVSNAWYYFSNKMILEIGIKDAKLSSNHLISKPSLNVWKFPFQFLYELLMSLSKRLRNGFRRYFARGRTGHMIKTFTLREFKIRNSRLKQYNSIAVLQRPPLHSPWFTKTKPFLFLSCRHEKLSGIAGLHVTSQRPCW